MSVKTTYELCKALEQTNETIKKLPKDTKTPKPKALTPAERQNEMSENSKIRFMDYYSDVVFSIMNVIEKHPERIDFENNKLVTIDKGEKIQEYVLSDVVMTQLRKWCADREIKMRGL